MKTKNLTQMLLFLNRALFFLALTVAALVAEEGDLVQSIDFETKPPPKIYDFGSGEAKCQTSVSDEKALSGSNSLKIETPGVVGFEGCGFSIPVPAPGRYVVTAQVSGAGEVEFWTSTGKPRTVQSKALQLSDQWQELKMSVFVKDSTFGFFILTVKKPLKTTFYIDDIKVVAAKPLPMTDVEVNSTRFACEGYVGNAKVIPDKTTACGSYVKGARWYVLCSKIPYPQTSRGVYAYAKVKTDSKQPALLSVANSMEGQLEQVFEAVEVTPGDKWQWLCLGPFVPQQFVSGLTFSNESAEKDTAVMLESIVVTTKSGLTPGQLDVIKPSE